MSAWGTQRRRLFGAALGSLLVVGARAGVESDRITLPPERREFHSSNGQWRLRVEALDPGWHKTDVAAELLHGAVASGQSRWRMPLAHTYGPRDAWVGADGMVLLIDEWINVASQRALVLIAPSGKTLASHGYAAIVAALGTTPAELGRHARRGGWMAGLCFLMPPAACCRSDCRMAG
jgi:hypothetical protein